MVAQAGRNTIGTETESTVTCRSERLCKQVEHGPYRQQSDDDCQGNQYRSTTGKHGDAHRRQLTKRQTKAFGLDSINQRQRASKSCSLSFATLNCTQKEVRLNIPFTATAELATGLKCDESRLITAMPCHSWHKKRMHRFEFSRNVTLKTQSHNANLNHSF